MWGFILPELLKAVEAEPENDVLAEHLASLARSVEKQTVIDKIPQAET